MVGGGISRRRANRCAVVGDGAIELAPGSQATPIDIGMDHRGIEPDRLAIVRNGAADVVHLLLDDARS